MPLYPYECDGCGHTENMFMSMKTEAAKLKCPKCNKKRLTRTISLPNWIVRDNYNNVGSASESNIKRMGKYAYSEMIEREKAQKKILKKDAQRAIAEATGGKVIETGENTLGLKDLDLNKVKDVTKYIATGDAN